MTYTLNLKLNSLQKQAFNAIFDAQGQILPSAPEELAIFGGFGNGKSLIVMLMTFLICNQYPNTKWLFCRATNPQLEDSVIAQFRELFPDSQGLYDFYSQKKEARFANGSTIYFRAFDGHRVKRVLSTNYDGASLCQGEEIAEELFYQIFGRLRGNNLPKKLFFIEGNPDDTWPRKRYKSGDLPPNCLFIEGSTHENKENLPQGYIARMEREFSPEWVERYILGNWERTSNLVHPGFDTNYHVIQPIPIESHWFKAIGFDHGTVNPSAMLWGAIDERHCLYIYDEFYAKHQSVEQLAEANKRHGTFPVPADYSMKKTERDFGSLWDDLQRAGINLIEAKKDKAANILLVNKLLHQRRLFISKYCVNLIRELSNYRWQKPRLGADTNRKEEVIKKDDHTCDALQYLVRYMHDMKVITPSPIPQEKTLQYHVVNEYSKERELIYG